MGYYPGSVNNPTPATTYGPLPDHGYTNVKLILHTTETVGMPGFNNGDYAPHYVYAPSTGIWTKWAEYEDGRVGTLKGHETNHANDMAFQVEILGYSDSAHEPWVGHFTDQNYQDLADFFAWSIGRYGIGTDVTPTPATGWLAGVNATTRGTWDEYVALRGLSAHGFVAGNTHWDTGVLDLQRIRDLAVGITPPPSGGDSGLLRRSTSARKYKSNIESAAELSAAVLNPVKFHHDGDDSDYVGFIAEDVIESLGSAAGEYGPDGRVEGYDLRAVVATLVAKVNRLET